MADVNINVNTEQVAQAASGAAGKMSEALGAMKETLATMFTNIMQYYGNIADLLGDVALMLSFVFVIVGLIKLKAYAQNPDQNPMSHILALFAVAGVMGNIGLAASIGGNTFFGDGYQFYRYDSVPGGTGISASGLAILQGILGFIQLVGFLAFFRGWLMVRNVGKPGEQPGTFSKALVFVVAGILCINIVIFLTILGNSMGLSGLSNAMMGTK